ncbi:MAG TPA: DUF177 domain-containing protein [Chloroflexia bacterium]|nr:DUF177 domain-containing protein [Chloroflexia bacterium]
MDAYTSNPDLIFNIAQLLKEPVGSTRRLELVTPELTLYDETGNGSTQGQAKIEARRVEGNVKVTTLRDAVLVQGDVSADVGLECSRCLEMFDLPVEATLEEQFEPTIDVYTGTPVRRAEDEHNDTAFEIDANHMMDLTEPVRQALLVALPMKPLCREDCAGICTQCGANRNETQCGHTEETVDDRWSGLRSLRLEDFPASQNRAN